MAFDPNKSMLTSKKRLAGGVMQSATPPISNRPDPLQWIKDAQLNAERRKKKARDLLMREKEETARNKRISEGTSLRDTRRSQQRQGQLLTQVQGSTRSLLAGAQNILTGLYGALGVDPTKSNKATLG